MEGLLLSLFHSLVKLRYRGWFTPWTQDKGEGQTIIMRAWEPLPVPLPTDQSSQDEQPEKAWEARQCLKAGLEEGPPVTLERKQLSPLAHLQKTLVTWYLPPSFPQWKDNLGCPGNFRWWLSLAPSPTSRSDHFSSRLYDSFPHISPLPWEASGGHSATSSYFYHCCPTGKGTWARAAPQMIVHSGPQSSSQPSSLIYSSDHAIPLWNVLILSPPQVPKPNFFLTSRERSKSTSPLLPNYSSCQLHYAGLWHSHLVLSTTCFLPITWKKFHLQISSAVSPFSPLHPAVPKSRLSKSLVSSSSQTFPR